MTLIAVPLAAAQLATLLADTARAKASGADLVEWRLDTCAAQGLDPRAAIAAIAQAALPVLVTIRHPSERGDWTGSEAERAALYAEADAAGAAWIDIELAHVATLGQRPLRAKLILSAHDFTGMGGGREALRERLRAMRAAGADVAKVAVMASDAADLAVVRELLVDRAGYEGDTIVLAMGEHGLPSRLLAGVWGAHLTFARLADQAGSAPGQPTVDDLVRLYRLKDQQTGWRIFGVIGSPIAHSMSPQLHNAAFAACDVAAVYVPFRVEDAPAFWRACGPWIDGVSITIPHKQALLDLIDVPGDEVRRVGAMNTIHREGGRSHSANTDVLAIAACLESATGDLSGKRVLCLGAGGVAKAIVHAGALAGATVAVTNRTHVRAVELAAEVAGTALTIEQALEWPYDILVNGTSQGMGKPDESPWPEDRHRRGTIVFDTVYTPLVTKLLLDAKRAGATPIMGVDMFIRQAAAQFMRFTDNRFAPPIDLMRRTVLDRLARKP